MQDSPPGFPLRLARGAEKELIAAGIPGPATFLAAGLSAALVALLVYFFRDPQRTPPAGAGLVLAPADGRVVAVAQAHEPHFLEGEGLKISIFMSLLDVHVNRAPVEGRVALVAHVPGRFLPAFRPEASEANEHNLIGLESRYGEGWAERLQLEDKGLCARACGAILSYLHTAHFDALGHLHEVLYYCGSEFMVLDEVTLRNLEILRNIRDRTRRGTLLEFL